MSTRRVILEATFSMKENLPKKWSKVAIKVAIKVAVEVAIYGQVEVAVFGQVKVVVSGQVKSITVVAFAE